MAKHHLEGTLVTCEADGCEDTSIWGTRDWGMRYRSVWIQEENRSYDACSEECAEKIKKKYGKG